MIFLGNLYPLRARICWHRFHWAELWGRYSLPDLGRYLDVTVKIALPLHVNRFLHMMWITEGPCTQLEIPFYFYESQSEIWNNFDIEVIIEYVIWLKMFSLTWSPTCLRLFVLEQVYHCHRVCPRERNPRNLRDLWHPWSLDNHIHKNYSMALYPY